MKPFLFININNIYNIKLNISFLKWYKLNIILTNCLSLIKTDHKYYKVKLNIVIINKYNNIFSMKISCMGAGYVGAPTTAVLAEHNP